MIVNTYSSKDNFDINNSNDNKHSNSKTTSDIFLNELNQTNNSNSSNETKIDNKEDDKWAMLEDIKSLMKRGVTSEELEMMEDLMKEIFKKLNKEPLGQDDIKDANKLLKKLENMILELKKRITGTAIKNADENSETGVSKDSLTFNLSSGDTIKIENIGTKIGSSLINRINDAIEGIKEIKEAKEKLEKTSQNSSSKEELELLSQLKKYSK